MTVGGAVLVRRIPNVFLDWRDWVVGFSVSLGLVDGNCVVKNKVFKHIEKLQKLFPLM